jgi:hypothetical protein
MTSDSDIPIIGEEEKEVELPSVEDFVRKLGESSIDEIPLLDIISMGLTDTHTLVFYLGDKSGDYYVKLMPHHELVEIGWKNRWKEYRERCVLVNEKHELNRATEDNHGSFPTDFLARPIVPGKCVWTDNGMMYNLNIWQDRQYAHIYKVLHKEVLSKIDIFARSKAVRKADPWR